MKYSIATCSTNVEHYYWQAVFEREVRPVYLTDRAWIKNDHCHCQPWFWSNRTSVFVKSGIREKLNMVVPDDFLSWKHPDACCWARRRRSCRLPDRRVASDPWPRRRVWLRERLGWSRVASFSLGLLYNKSALRRCRLFHSCLQLLSFPKTKIINIRKSLRRK